jgi:Ser/Thr protein kinase RdoA (MazF antagonist)
MGASFVLLGYFNMASLRVVHSTVSADDLGALASVHFPIGSVASCRLLTRGFNDTYELRAESGERYVLRLGARRSHRSTDLDYEVAFLGHLAAADVPIAAPVAARDGRVWKPIRLPERERPAVLFRFLEGRKPAPSSVAEARAQAKTLARVHVAGETFPNPPRRFVLDLDHLVRRPTEAIATLPVMDADSRSYLDTLAAQLIREVNERSSQLTRCHCHGDCHGYNARITDGTLEPTATLFDFDDGGPGFLAYDLAVFLWSTRTFMAAERRHLWRPFVEEYQDAHPISAADLEAIPLFVAARHLWLMGEYAARTDEWGTDWLNEVWLERQLAFLREWEQSQLATSRLI